MTTASEAGPARFRLIVLFGLPGSGVLETARAIDARGFALATDAATDGERFGVSAELDRLASDLATPDSALMDAAIGRALGGDRTRGRLIVAGVMGSGPRDWLDAFARTGMAVTPVLVHRNPLALARLAREVEGRPVRQGVFAWHGYTLGVLEADAGALEVLVSPELDLRAIGFGGDLPRIEVAPHPKDEADLSRAPAVSAQSRDLDALVRGWRTLDPSVRGERVAALRERFDDAVVLTGATPGQPKPERAERAARPRRATPALPEPRPVARTPLLFHYHIFKNAGTSVDRMLKANFGELWAEQEFGGGPPSTRHGAIRAYLEERPQLHAFSSHTAPLPVPDLPDREIFPILFVRHPLLRVRSAYEFERKQDADTRGAIVAKQTDLAGYVTTFLDDPKLRHVRNFQALRFATGTPGPPVQERRRALETMDRLPFVGLVEAYDASVARLGELIRPLFPDFQVIALHENATSAKVDRSLEDRLAALRDELGPALYERLLAENAIDLEVFERVRASYAVSL